MRPTINWYGRGRPGMKWRQIDRTDSSPPTANLLARLQRAKCDRPVRPSRRQKAMNKLHRIIHRAALPLATFGPGREDLPTDSGLLDSFIRRCQAMDRPRI